MRNFKMFNSVNFSYFSAEPASLRHGLHWCMQLLWLRVIFHISVILQRLWQPWGEIRWTWRNRDGALRSVVGGSVMASPEITFCPSAHKVSQSSLLKLFKEISSIIRLLQHEYIKTVSSGHLTYMFCLFTTSTEEESSSHLSLCFRMFLSLFWKECIDFIFSGSHWIC